MWYDFQVSIFPLKKITSLNSQKLIDKNSLILTILFTFQEIQEKRKKGLWFCNILILSQTKLEK